MYKDGMVKRDDRSFFSNQRKVGFVAVALALMGAISGLFLASRDKERQEIETLHYRMQGQSDVTVMARQVSDLGRQAEKNTATINAITLALKSEDITRANSKGLGMRPEERRELSQVEETQQQILSRMAALESALVNTSEKALALPLLKQQLSDTQDRFKGDMDETHAEFGRLYTLVQWALGLIITIILGMGGFLIARRKEAEPLPTKRSPETAPQA